MRDALLTEEAARCQPSPTIDERSRQMFAERYAEAADDGQSSQCTGGARSLARCKSGMAYDARQLTPVAAVLSLCCDTGEGGGPGPAADFLQRMAGHTESQWRREELYDEIRSVGLT